MYFGIFCACHNILKTRHPYLSDGLLHLRLRHAGNGGFQVVHDALEAVALHYLPLMAAEEAERHLEHHLGALDEEEV